MLYCSNTQKLTYEAIYMHVTGICTVRILNVHVYQSSDLHTSYTHTYSYLDYKHGTSIQHVQLYVYLRKVIYMNHSFFMKFVLLGNKHHVQL